MTTARISIQARSAASKTMKYEQDPVQPPADPEISASCQDAEFPEHSGVTALGELAVQSITEPAPKRQRPGRKSGEHDVTEPMRARPEPVELTEFSESAATIVPGSVRVVNLRFPERETYKVAVPLFPREEDALSKRISEMIRERRSIKS